MAKFIQLREPSATLINIENVVTVYRGSRTANEQDEKKALEAEVGQDIYFISFLLITGGVTTVDFLKKEYRDSCYKEIIALVNPILIGAGLPLKSKASSEENAQSAAQQPTPTPPTPKPPRKPRTLHK